jgi:hypothetical protein
MQLVPLLPRGSLTVVSVLITIASVLIGGAVTGRVAWILARSEVRRRHRLVYLIKTYTDLTGACASSTRRTDPGRVRFRLAAVTW